jgi:hypothetical protein
LSTDSQDACQFKYIPVLFKATKLFCPIKLNFISFF